MNESNIIQIQAAKERFPDLFGLTDELIQFFHDLMYCRDILSPQNNIDLIKLATLSKVNNLFISSNLLLQHDHWEEAKIINRSLFELLLNIEEIFRDEEKVEYKISRFLLFGELQKYLNYKADLDYKVKTGRMELTSELSEVIKKMDNAAERQFNVFLKKSKRSKYWNQYWIEERPWELAEKSKNSVRMSQYQILYSDMSNFVHSSPASIMAGVQRKGMDENLESEALEIGEQALLMISFAQEILFFVGKVSPKFDPLRMLEIARKVKAYAHSRNSSLNNVGGDRFTNKQ